MHQPELVCVAIPEVAAWVEGELGSRRLARWFSPCELETYGSFPVEKRRRDWLAGRIAGKSLIARRHRLTGADAFRRIRIQPAAAGPDQGRPFYAVDGVRGPFSLSITHCGAQAMAALAASEAEEVGVDLEQALAREPSFESVALSPAERELVSGLSGESRQVFTTRLWVLKEALSKALGLGLRLPFASLSVALDRKSGRLDSERPFSMAGAFAGELRARPQAAACFERASSIGAWVLLKRRKKT